MGEWELPPFCHGTPIPNIIFPVCLSHPAAGPLRGVVLNKIDFHCSVICEMSSLRQATSQKNNHSPKGLSADSGVRENQGVLSVPWVEHHTDQWPGVAGFFTVFWGSSCSQGERFRVSPPSQPPSCFLAFYFVLFLFLLFYVSLFYFILRWGLTVCS